MGLALTMSPEIARLFRQKDDHLRIALEERILSLRMEVDRLHSRQYLETGNLNLQLQELLQQQEVLSRQQQIIQTLARTADDLGLSTPALASVPSPDTPPTATPAAIDPTTTGSIFQRPDAEKNPAARMAAISAALNIMQDQSRTVLQNINQAAARSADTILSQLQRIGIHPETAPRQSAAVGGPFIPAREQDFPLLDATR